MSVQRIVCVFLLHEWAPFIDGTTSSGTTTIVNNTTVTSTMTSPTSTPAQTAAVKTTTATVSAYIASFELPLEIIGYTCIALFFLCVPLICICDCISRKCSGQPTPKSESKQKLTASSDKTEMKDAKKPTKTDIPKTRKHQPIRAPIIEASLLDPKVPPRYNPSKTPSTRAASQPRYYTRVSNVT